MSDFDKWAGCKTFPYLN